MAMETVAAPTCARCRGFGYKLPDVIDRGFPKQVPAGVLYREGTACGCVAGTEFALAQELWRAEERDAEHAQDRPGHAMDVEQRTFAGEPVERHVCACGWAGPWYRAGRFPRKPPASDRRRLLLLEGGAHGERE